MSLDPVEARKRLGEFLASLLSQEKELEVMAETLKADIEAEGLTEANKAAYVAFQQKKIGAMQTGLKIFKELKVIAPEILPDKDLAGFHQVEVNIVRHLNNARNDLAAFQKEDMEEE